MPSKREEIIRCYPKTYQLLKTWLVSIVKQQGIKEEMLAVFPIDNMMDAMLSANPRILYDFFDTYNVELLLSHNPIGWTFSFTTEHYETRRSAEDAGFKECFTILEQKL